METGDARAYSSLASLLSVGLAVGSFYTGPAAGFMLALVAIAFGIVGMVLSQSPQERRTIVGMFALGLGILGILIALTRAVAWGRSLVLGY